jgi:hypothetical protein
MGVWQGVAMDSLNFYPGSPCATPQSWNPGYILDEQINPDLIDLILDTSIFQINLGYFRDRSQNLSQIYLGYILRFIWDSKAGG